MGIVKKALGLAAIAAVAAWVNGKKRKDDAAMWEDVGFAGESRSHGSWQEPAAAGSAADSTTESSSPTGPKGSGATGSKTGKSKPPAGGNGSASSEGADQTGPEGGTA